MSIHPENNHWPLTATAQEADAIADELRVAANAVRKHNLVVMSGRQRWTP